MADRRVRYVLEVDYEGESVVIKAADDLRQVDDAAREAGDGFSKLQASIVTAQSALGLVQEGFAAVQNAARMAWETLSEGSALADARGDFADLAAEIGSTAGVMESELGRAAAGLKTDAELIAEASELMGLNLGLTQGQIVDLTGVAAELDWNMQMVGDTINTGATRSLKELGLNVGETKARIAELREEGHSLNEAMALAMIEAGEEKIARVGKRSEESAGQLEILTNVVTDVQDAFALGSAEGFAAALATIATSAPAAGEGMEYAARGAASWAAELGGLAILSMFASTIEYFAEKGREMEQTERALATQGMWMAEGYEAQAVAVEEATRARERATAAAETHTFSLEEEAAEMEAAAERSEWLARAAAWVSDEQHRAAAADYERALAVAELNQEMANQEAAMAIAGQAAQAWAEYTAEATARGGDYFEQITRTGRAQFDLNDAMYAAAGAYGAGAADLGAIGVETGQFSQRVAEAGVAAAQSQVIVESLAGAAQSGRVAWDEYTTAVERALGILNDNDYLIDLGPRQAPEMEDRGFREGYGEDFQPDTREISPYAVVLEADNQAVLDAVEEARGVVEGFTSPAEVYEAVMDLNITAVEEKGEIVRGIIENLPTRKTVTIDIEIENPALLEQLRAIGAIQ